ncbi:MAG TPA: ergothioneine biosynthesis protein EgtB [Acidimicrobiales bacterium]|nr:ergothioneine biosynthesis protein EgtB [Acidimicrobiales bacterium]
MGALNDDLAGLLSESRARTLGLVAPFDDAVLRRQHDVLMSPLVWDLAHVANYEDLWLVRALGGEPTTPGPDIDDLYDAFKQPRNVREALPTLSPAEARAYGAAVRERALERLAGADLGADNPDALLAHGYVHQMVGQHEHQHAETLLAAIQLLPVEEGHRFGAVPPPAAGRLTSTEVRVPAGRAPMGSAHPWSYDNERPRHEVELDAYWIDTAPVSNADFALFIEEGGYEDPRHWTEAGWAWRQEAGLVAPRFWRRVGEVWLRARFGNIEEVPADEPVQHVCWYEADAFARWAGKRLPTEAEWERAASWDVVTGLAHPWPWGELGPTTAHANLGQGLLRPAPIGAYPLGVSPVGCHQMIGDVWEWTATDFGPYPGFRAFPYDEYSAVFHGDRYKVLRGGSWATHPSACRTTFRNWDLPIRRQIFAGFRCARDDR